MTAARGIIHEEFHSTEFHADAAACSRCAQLWLNLPAKHKMDPPRVPAHPREGHPGRAARSRRVQRRRDNETRREAGENCTIRVIAGDEATYGVKGAASTHTPVELLDVRVAVADVDFDVPVPDGHNTVVFVRRGGITVGEGKKKVEQQGVALMHLGGDTLRLTATEKDTEILVLAGEPIDEPIAARGPFVMNTHEEISRANKDFMNGLMGQ